ncbi:Hpt domain-containing protein [bacterium]|nr:Hpt domain-containing protein [bacterium]MCP5462291.1 Hpt domain-containing protein [bacterium]
MNREEKMNILKELPGVSEEIYDTLVHDLIEQTRERIPEFRQEISVKNFLRVKELAHYIKGCAGSLRVTAIFEITKSIQSIAESSCDAQHITDLLAQLERNIKELEKSI